LKRFKYEAKIERFNAKGQKVQAKANKFNAKYQEYAKLVNIDVKAKEAKKAHKEFLHSKEM